MKIAALILCVFTFTVINAFSQREDESLRKESAYRKTKRALWPHFDVNHDGMKAADYFKICRERNECAKGYTKMDIEYHNVDTVDMKVFPNPEDNEGWWGLLGAGEHMLTMKDSDKVTITMKLKDMQVRETCLYCFGVRNAIFKYFLTDGTTRTEKVMPLTNENFFMFNCLNNGWMSVTKIEITFDHGPPTFNCRQIFTEACKKTSTNAKNSGKTSKKSGKTGKTGKKGRQ